MKIILGITGDVGSGKSTLCKTWKEMGAHVLDADRVAKNLWFRKTIQKRASKRWGDNFFECDKVELMKKIADKIFNDEEEYKFATKLLHKITISELKTRAKRSKSQWIVVEIPLLFECGRPDWIDKVVYVTADVKKRAVRNVSRGWNIDELLRREEKLISTDEKLKQADLVLENNGTYEEWIETVRKQGKIFINQTQNM